MSDAAPSTLSTIFNEAHKYGAMFFKTAGLAIGVGGALGGSIMLAGVPAGLIACTAGLAFGFSLAAAPAESMKDDTKRTLKGIFIAAIIAGGALGGVLSGDTLGGAILAPAAILAAVGLGKLVASPANRLAPDLDKFMRPALPLEKAFKTAVAATVLGGIALGVYSYKKDTLAFVDKTRASLSQMHVAPLPK